MNAGIKDKAVLILGGAGGIGSAAARHLASEGARIVVADINGPKAAALAQEIRSTGAEARDDFVDVVKKHTVERVSASVVNDLGTIDVLINAAGVMLIRPLTEINTAE